MLNGTELISYGELRNAIVHNPRIGSKTIAEPHPETVKKIKQLISWNGKFNISLEVSEIQTDKQQKPYHLFHLLQND